MNELQKRDVLKLPVSIRSWILLRHYLDETWYADIFCKIIEDYYDEIPLFEVRKMYSTAESRLNDADFQKVLNHLFKAKYRVNILERTTSAIWSYGKYWDKY